ncbi:MAG: hypothetical protein HY778_03960 [Betaproteobacteria bacterium]|nr:hypothetical protein [Betaproteobacteria bacterium]
MSDQDLKRFYQTLLGTDPLKNPTTDHRYVAILQANPRNDPIEQLRQRIDWAASESVHLLTGFRGNGKTTEIYRLKGLLEESGCRVVRLDMDDYLNSTQPVEISDFLLSVMAGLASILKEVEGLDAITESYWTRLGNFLTTEVKLEKLDIEMKAAGAAAKLGFKLKNEPSFKQQVQHHLRGHVARLVEEAHGFVTEVVQTLRQRSGNPDLKVVILVDSVEHLRGVGTDAQGVYDSVLNTFSVHGDKLALPQVHVLYTVPPFLVLHANSATRTMGGNPIVMWPNVHVLCRDGSRDPAGLAVMRDIIGKRFPDWERIIPGALLDELAASTGGDLRDFFRQVREVLVRLGVARKPGEQAPVADPATVESVSGELRNSLRLMLTERDRQKLGLIHRSKQLKPDGPQDIPTLTTLLDSNLIMNYQNGEPWFDIHPMLREDMGASPATP